MTESTNNLYYCRDSAKSLQTILDKIEPEEKAIFHWYEPIPESLIDKPEALPVFSFGRGEPNEIKGDYSELMLFYPSGGLTVIRQDDDRSRENNYSYFFWSENEFNGSKSMPYDLKQKPEKALLNSKGLLKDQYDLDVPNKDYPEKLKMVRYLKAGKCVAWTLEEN